MADLLLKDPKISQTDAYIATHKTKSKQNANIQASKLLAKPSVQIYMQQHETLAKETVVDIMNNSQKDDTRLKAAFDVLDRNLGKAIQKSENQNVNLNLNIEANKELSENFTDFLKKKTHSEAI